MGNDIVFTLEHAQLSGVQWLSSNPSALKVLSLHGWLDNAASFINLAPYLNDFNHVAVDMAGHGLSEHRAQGCFYHLWDYVLDIVSILNLSNQRSWLIGHSMGGAVAMLVAAIAPEKVRGLIVLDNMGPLTATASDRVVTLQRSVQKMIKHRKGRYTNYPTMDDMVLARMDGFTQLSKSAALPLVKRGGMCAPNGNWIWRHDNKLTYPSPFRMDESSVEAFIKEIKCPTLALVAKEGVYAQNRELVERRASQFPWIKLRWLDGNHHFHLEPETAQSVAEEIHKFIDQN